MTTNQIIIALMAGAFQAYIIYRLMHIFFEQDSRWGQGELASYVIYWVINSAVYLGQDNAMIVLLSNIALYLALSLQYSRLWRKRVLGTILTLGLTAVSEGIVTLGMNALGYGHPFYYDDGTYLMCQLAIQIVSFAIVLLYANIKRSRQEVKLPLLYWFATFMVPLSTLYVVTIFSLVEESGHMNQILLCALVMFGLNIMIFYLYDGLQTEYQEKLTREMIAQQNKLDNERLARQNDAYVKELNLIADSNERIRMIRHDTINHVIVLRNLISQSKNEEALQYLSRLENETAADEAELFRTGNLIIDGILNAKVTVIQQSQIKVERHINIPDKLAIAAFDLSVIIGNLMDNAIEAVQQLPEEQRKIKLQMTYDGSALYLFVSNPCDKELDIQDGLIETSKTDQDNHGLGLKSVHRSVDRYPGSLWNVNTEDGWFCAEMMLYEPENERNSL